MFSAVMLATRSVRCCFASRTCPGGARWPVLGVVGAWPPVVSIAWPGNESRRYPQVLGRRGRPGWTGMCWMSSNARLMTRSGRVSPAARCARSCCCNTATTRRSSQGPLGPGTPGRGRARGLRPVPEGVRGHPPGGDRAVPALPGREGPRGSSTWSSLSATTPSPAAATTARVMACQPGSGWPTTRSGSAARSPSCMPG